MRLALLLCVHLIAAGEAEPDIPDPYGLGKRLALMEHLRELKANPPAGATYDELVALYRARALAVPALTHEQAAERERAARLRAELARHEVKTDGTETEAALLELMAKARAARDEREREARKAAEERWEQQAGERRAALAKMAPGELEDGTKYVLLPRGLPDVVQGIWTMRMMALPGEEMRPIARTPLATVFSKSMTMAGEDGQTNFREVYGLRKDWLAACMIFTDTDLRITLTPADDLFRVVVYDTKAGKEKLKALIEVAKP